MIESVKGLFITFEGIEGCGKSTQAQLLKDALADFNYQVLLSREPGGTVISEAIRKILLNLKFKEMLPETEMLLYMASRSQHTGQLILPALRAGKIVICDRYYDSTIAYQGAARNLDLSVIELITSFATFNTDPDLTILIDIPVDVGLSRIEKRKLDRLEQEGIEFHNKVRDQYLQIASKYSSRYFIIDGREPIEVVHKNIKELVLSKINSQRA